MDNLKKLMKVEFEGKNIILCKFFQIFDEKNFEN
jgi:hypothetical protein